MFLGWPANGVTDINIKRDDLLKGHLFNSPRYLMVTLSDGLLACSYIMNLCGVCNAQGLMPHVLS